VDQVDHDRDVGATLLGLGGDQIGLVLRAVDERDPVAAAFGIAGLGLVEYGEYALCLAFRVHGDTLDWLFARTLLISGLHEPVGAGDVEINPSRRDGVDTVQITLKARYAYAVLEAPAGMIADFLTRTCRAVPPGTEHRHLDLDDLVCRLVHNPGGSP
jgi:hypothetical protein